MNASVISRCLLFWDFCPMISCMESAIIPTTAHDRFCKTVFGSLVSCLSILRRIIENNWASSAYEVSLILNGVGDSAYSIPLIIRSKTNVIPIILQIGGISGSVRHGIGFHRQIISLLHTI